MGLHYEQYDAEGHESSLSRKYGLRDVVVSDPEAAKRDKGWGFVARVYLGGQNVTLDLSRFRHTLTRLHARALRVAVLAQSVCILSANTNGAETTNISTISVGADIGNVSSHQRNKMKCQGSLVLISGISALKLVALTSLPHRHEESLGRHGGTMSAPSTLALSCTTSAPRRLIFG
uniref:Uncharacterized protein n=1 Tax=Oryza nivara TaxID=4536 RepID=A0A0E0FYZ7_ORYNI